MDSEPAVVNDRPGHYRRLVTARDRQLKERSQRRSHLLVVGIVLMGVFGVALIILSATPKRPGSQPAEVPATPQVPDAQAATPPPEPIALRIETDPPFAEVFEKSADGLRRLGRTPHDLKRPQGAQVTFVLRKEGYQDHVVVLGFDRGRSTWRHRFERP